MREKTKAPVKKPVHKSRTNQSVAALVAIFLINLVRQHFGLSFSPEVESVISDEVLPVVITSLGALAVMFRQKAELYAPELTSAVDQALEEGESDDQDGAPGPKKARKPKKTV